MIPAEAVISMCCRPGWAGLRPMIHLFSMYFSMREKRASRGGSNLIVSFLTLKLVPSAGNLVLRPEIAPHQRTPLASPPLNVYRTESWIEQHSSCFYWSASLSLVHARTHTRTLAETHTSPSPPNPWGSRGVQPWHCPKTWGAAVFLRHRAEGTLLLALLPISCPRRSPACLRHSRLRCPRATQPDPTSRKHHANFVPLEGLLELQTERRVRDPPSRTPHRAPQERE